MIEFDNSYSANKSNEGCANSPKKLHTIHNFSKSLELYKG